MAMRLKYPRSELNEALPHESRFFLVCFEGRVIQNKNNINKRNKNVVMLEGEDLSKHFLTMLGKS
jgi:hypothetical protein